MKILDIDRFEFPSKQMIDLDEFDTIELPKRSGLYEIATFATVCAFIIVCGFILLVLL